MLSRGRVPALQLIAISSFALSACEGAKEQASIDSGLADVSVPDFSVRADGGEPDSGIVDAEVIDQGSVDAGAVDPLSRITPLFSEATELEPALREETPASLITRFADRGRDRHAREDQFQAYEHYLPLYWEHRTAEIEIVDTVGRGGDTITFNVTSQWRLQAMQAELRFFYRGLNTVAEYHDNRPMTRIDDLHYTHAVSFNAREGRPLQVGDRMEFELSQFLDAPPRGRSNYYGTVFLYVVGEGIEPWLGRGPTRDSQPLALAARLGGMTTLHRNESNEPQFAFSQMATNIAPHNAQPFMRGRRLAHTDFFDGRHDESDQNPVWQAQSGKLGPRYIDVSCNACHLRNGRAPAPEEGEALRGFVVKLADAEGGPHPAYGGVLQPSDASEPTVSLARWEAQDALRRPIYEFDGANIERHSARISPQLVGMGLLEAIPEQAIAANADPQDLDGDGISGRMSIVVDARTAQERLGRFGWKAGQPTVLQQVASALRTDMGVLSSVFPAADCGAEQSDCTQGAELDDTELRDLALYVALLGVPPQDDAEDPEVVQGRALFEEVGCARCHVPSFVTSEFAAQAELRGQSISPFTDLLLHDLGPGLADELSEGEATGAEWRTPPLWGIGKTAEVSGAESYLHDGRARTLEEAIRWHGGEAERVTERFLALTPPERARLLAFVRSL